MEKRYWELSKLREYALVKNISVLNHISYTHKAKPLTAMARYRMSSDDLNIERGRYNNPITPINQRIYTRCELNEIDDEIHLLLHCNAKNNEREISLNSVAAIVGTQTFRPIVSSHHFLVGRFAPNSYLGKTFRPLPINRKDVSPPSS